MNFVAGVAAIADCDVDFRDHNPRSWLPALRGLAVLHDGTVLAAAVGCRAVIKISTNGSIATVLKAEKSWSPTGVAVHGQDVYVLDYTNAHCNPNEGEAGFREFADSAATEKSRR